MKNKIFRIRLVREITGDVEKSDRPLLEMELNESPEKKREHDQFKTIWLNTMPAGIPELPRIDSEWNKLRERIKSGEDSSVVTQRIQSTMKYVFQLLLAPKWKPAIGALILLLLVSLSLFIINRNGTVQKKLIITTLSGETKSAQLPDGSTVYLNAGSRIEALEDFGEKFREVDLSGEAFFSVRKESRPFIVSTANAKVTVLGTKFNVRTSGDLTKVVVIEGRVNLSSKNTEAKNVFLSANQFSIVTQDFEPTEPYSVDAGYLPGWMRGKLVFNKTSLGEVALELESYYNVKIKIGNDSLKLYALTGSFKDYPVDTVLSMICLALELDYEKRNDEYLLMVKSHKDSAKNMFRNKN